MDPYIVLGSAVIGFLVGVTGAGGVADDPDADPALLGEALHRYLERSRGGGCMRPIGAAVHLRRGTVNLRLVGWLTLGSVPMAFLGAYLLHVIGHAHAAQGDVQIALGAALLVGAAAMVLRYVLDRRGGHTRQGVVHDLTLRPVADGRRSG